MGVAAKIKSFWRTAPTIVVQMLQLGAQGSTDKRHATPPILLADLVWKTALGKTLQGGGALALLES